MKTSICMVSAVCALLLGQAAFGATAYASREAFDAATVGYVQKTAINFDSQAPGTPAEHYGNMHIAADGLASDGATWITLPPIATDAFLATSDPNALGNSVGDSQFLAGNGDTITFSFSSPVYAFGAYLVGDPSPTGDPAVPFWRMHAADLIGWFDAFSAVDPIYSLGSGNDVYFLGIVSTDRPFSVFTLYSDNDPDAVFSFNVDDVVYATLPPEVTIAGAKSLAAGDVRVTAIVTRAHADRFNIETPDRSHGIAVIGTGATRGKAVTITGSVSGTADGERVINLYGVIAQSDSTPPGPFGMGSLSVGGGAAFGEQIGIPGSFGPNNVGLDALVWGTITGIAPDGSWMTVDDGAGRPSGEGTTGVKVVGWISPVERQVGRFATVRGSVSIWKPLDTDSYYPLIRVAAPAAP